MHNFSFVHYFSVIGHPMSVTGNDAKASVSYHSSSTSEHTIVLNRATQSSAIMVTRIIIAFSRNVTETE